MQDLLDLLVDIRDQLSVFDTEIPYVSENLVALIDLVNAFQSGILDPITEATSSPASLTAKTLTLQEVAAELASRLGMDAEQFGLHYGENADTGAKELTYELSLHQTFSGSQPFNFGVEGDGAG